MGLRPSGSWPATTASLALAAAQLQDHLRRQIEAQRLRLRVDAALETVARVGQDARLAARLAVRTGSN